MMIINLMILDLILKCMGVETNKQGCRQEKGVLVCAIYLSVINTNTSVLA